MNRHSDRIPCRFRRTAEHSPPLAAASFESVYGRQNATRETGGDHSAENDRVTARLRTFRFGGACKARALWNNKIVQRLYLQALIISRLQRRGQVQTSLLIRSWTGMPQCDNELEYFTIFFQTGIDYYYGLLDHF